MSCLVHSQEVGELLQARRHTDFVMDFGCRSVDDFQANHGSDDPATKDDELAAKLAQNAKVSLLRLGMQRKCKTKANLPPF